MPNSSTIIHTYLQVQESLHEVHRARAIFSEINFEDDLSNIQFIS